MQQLTILFLFLTMLITAGCKWNLYNTSLIPLEMKKIIFDSFDPNNYLSRAIRNQLHLNKIKIIENSYSYQNIPLLRILNSSIAKDAVSVFQDGQTAEFQIVLSVNTEVLIPGKDIYPIDLKVYRSFFEHSQIALENDLEESSIIKEMYNKASEQLIYKLANIQIEPKKLPYVTSLQHK